MEKKLTALREEEAANTIMFFLVSGLYLTLIGVLALVTYKSFASPIRKLEMAAKNSIDHNKPFTLGESGPYEIRSVTKRLRNLIGGLEKRVKKELLRYSIVMKNLSLKWSSVKNWRPSWFMLRRWKRLGSWHLWDRS